MKRIVLSAIVLFSVALLNAQPSAAESLANKIANKIKDTLSLSSPQRDEIYRINMSLASQKSAARQQFSGDSLTVAMQRIENKRDSLYHTIITNEEKYLLYKQKKRNLVNNN